MKPNKYDMGDIDIAWCPGCGNFEILEMLKSVLSSRGLRPEEVVLVSGIGQAAKIPHYLNVHFFNGLHGRAVPPATAIKAVNPRLTVIAESGDGDMYGEGGNHLLHAIRRNPDITVIVHNNMVYGLTKGQASPTSGCGFRTPLQIDGVVLSPLNPVSLAVSQDASFVARAFIGDTDKTSDIVARALKHKGFALVDIFQPCVSFNKVNTFKWFKEHTYYLEKSHDSADRGAAFSRSQERDPLPLGVFYVNDGKKTYEDNTGLYEENNTPLSLRRRGRVTKLTRMAKNFV